MISRRSARRPSARAGRLLEASADGVSRLVALALIALILLPFTAPFRTCELDRPHKTRPCDVVANDKLLEDGVVPVATCSLIPPVLVAPAVLSSHLQPADFERLRHTNLRL
jgi:hypothetical protein